MRRFEFLSKLIILGFVWLPAKHCLSQDHLLDYLDNSIAAVVVVNQPRDIVRYFKELGVTEDARWKKAVELAVDDSFGFLTPDDLEVALSHLDSVVELIEAASEFGIVWHGSAAGEKELDISVVIRCQEDKRQAAAQIAEWFDTFIKNIGLRHSFNISVHNCENTDWIVISNTAEGQELSRRLDTGTASKNLLSSTRRFRRVFGDSLDVEGERPLIYMYGEVEKLSKVFYYADLSPELREAYKFNEFVGLGLKVDLKKIAVGDSHRSVVWETILPCTLPRSGLAEIIDTYKPLGKFPPIPMEFYELTAYAYDPMRL